MRRFQSSLWLWACALLTALGLSTGTARADHPLAGKWKVTVLEGTDETTIWLIQLDEKDGKFSGKVLAAGVNNFDKVKFDAIKVTDQSLHARLILHGMML